MSLIASTCYTWSCDDVDDLKTMPTECQEACKVKYRGKAIGNSVAGMSNKTFGIIFGIIGGIIAIIVIIYMYYKSRY